MGQHQLNVKFKIFIFSSPKGAQNANDPLQGLIFLKMPKIHLNLVYKTFLALDTENKTHDEMKCFVDI